MIDFFITFSTLTNMLFLLQEHRVRLHTFLLRGLHLFLWPTGVQWLVLITLQCVLHITSCDCPWSVWPGCACPILSQGSFVLIGTLSISHLSLIAQNDTHVYVSLVFQFPVLYQEGVQNVLFSWDRILSWTINGGYSSACIFFFCIYAMEYQAFHKGGEVVCLEILGTCMVWVVNCQMALYINYFTNIEHFVIWGSIVLWYVFLLAYGAMSPLVSTTAFMVFIEACALSVSFWLVTFSVLVLVLVPYFMYSAIQRLVFPMYHHMVQWIRLNGQADDPEYCNIFLQSSFKHWLFSAFWSGI